MRSTAEATPAAGWRRARTAVTHLALCALCGCLSLPEGGSVARRLWLLAPSPVQALTDAPLRGSIAIVRVQLPAYLDRQEIVRRDSPNRVVLSPLDVWAEPLEQSFADTLRTNLSSALAGTLVQVGLRVGDADPLARITVLASRFDGAPGGDVVLEAMVRIQRDRTQSSRRFELRARADAGIGGLVTALERLNADLAKAVARELVAAD